jgi:polyferredoxin
MTLSKRLRLLRVLHAQPHRYRRIRWITQTITLTVLAAIPLLGLARLDLWDGRHLAARHPAGAILGVGAAFAGVLSFYVVTFALNAVLGRIFCGFGCPVAQANRLGEDAEIAAKTGGGRVAAELLANGFAIALASAIALWLVSPWVLVRGSARAVAVTIGAVLALAVAIRLHGRFFRWRFCEAYCPIGIYYSAVQTSHGFGVHFDGAAGTCKQCGACEVACPVGLDPRDLTKPKDDIGGLAIDGFPGHNHCLTCGECVRACEHQLRRAGRGLVPLRLSSRRPAREETG